MNIVKDAEIELAIVRREVCIQGRGEISLYSEAKCILLIRNGAAMEACIRKSIEPTDMGESRWLEAV